MEQLNQDTFKGSEEIFYQSPKTKKKWYIPFEQKFNNVFSNLSIVERLILLIFISLFIFSGISIFFKLNNALLIEIPAQRGSFTEGVIGFPRTINPLLSVDSSEADKDLVMLVYSGLLKATPNGGLIPDLAKSYSVSEDGLVYNFKLKDNIYFQDGTEITSADVKFTIEKAQDPLTKSPKRINWEGVQVKILNEKELNLILPDAYAPFEENTTLGILPKHLWENLDPGQFASTALNLEPVGSGPYKIESVKRNGDGLPTYYVLKAFSDYALKKPNIQEIYLRFYQNEEDLITAFKNGEIESMNSVSPRIALSLKNDANEINRGTLSRIFGVFFNQNQAPIFTLKEVRQALEISLDKEGLINEVLNGYGKPLSSPVPLLYKDQSTKEVQTSPEEKLEEAKKILEKAGWEFDDLENIWKKKIKTDEIRLEFSISTSDTPDLKATAQIIKENWEKLGAKVDVKVFDLSDLKQNIIRPRKYDALFFGTVIGRNLDLYPFWHSSQRNDPGLNISLYVNSQTDKILESIRRTTDKEKRIEKYKEFEKIITEEIPAVFTYSPDFIYLTPKRIKDIKLDFLVAPNERFLNVEDWYVETDKVWSIFTD